MFGPFFLFLLHVPSFTVCIEFCLGFFADNTFWSHLAIKRHPILKTGCRIVVLRYFISWIAASARALLTHCFSPKRKTTLSADPFMCSAQ